MVGAAPLMLKRNLPSGDTPGKPPSDAGTRKIAPSVRAPIKSLKDDGSRESVARRIHRQRMKTYFSGGKPPG